METLQERLSNSLTLAVNGEDASAYLSLVCTLDELKQLKREATTQKRLDLILEAIQTKELLGAGV